MMMKPIRFADEVRRAEGHEEIAGLYRDAAERDPARRDELLAKAERHQSRAEFHRAAAAIFAEHPAPLDSSEEE